MEIIFQIKDRVFAISMGRKTKWFEQIYIFCLEELWYENREVVYGKIIRAF